jgi:hypothetical protein
MSCDYKTGWVRVLVAGLLGLTAALAQKTVQGPSGDLWGSKVQSWASVDAQGRVAEAGFTVPMKALRAASPGAGHQGMGPDLVLDFPEVVKRTTFLDHMEFWWEPQGHPPERFLVPHFDLHFFGVPAAEVAKIDCKDLTTPAPELTPKGYAPAVPPGANAAEFCVPLMGFHSVPLSEFSAPGQLKPGRFDHVMIAGFYGGRFIFTEPMITQAVLLQKETVRLAVGRPDKVGRKTLYPTTFVAQYDPTQDAYRLVFGGFQAGE